MEERPIPFDNIPTETVDVQICHDYCSKQTFKKSCHVAQFEELSSTWNVYPDRPVQYDLTNA